LLIKLLINIERTVDLCVITKKEIHMRTQELWVRAGYNIPTCIFPKGVWERDYMLHTGRSTMLESSDFDSGTVSQATKTNGIDRLPRSYVCRSSHW